LRRLTDENALRRALALAEKGRYSTSPNPMVGAVVARAGRVIAEGYHDHAGGPHAEIVALRRAGVRARGATLYVTLEPCRHVGATGPCTEAILAAGITRVVACRRDPNPLAKGRGFARLRLAGMAVDVGLLSAVAARQNERFDRWITAGRPFVMAKAAASLDGRIADRLGASRWISGKASRHRAMLWREEFDAILVGEATASRDGARLTRRIGRNRTTPQIRIVLDGRFRIREDAPIFRQPRGVEIWTSARNGAKERRLARRGVAVLHWAPGADGRIDLRAPLGDLGRRGVTGLIVEGGSRTFGAFHDSGLVDRWAVFLSPLVLGGRNALAMVGGSGSRLVSTELLRDVEVERIGSDILLTGTGH